MSCPQPRPHLPRETLVEVVRHTPLVSIDLICRDPQGRVLLGWRSNRPAQASWFVPGGRILKDERIEQAIERIAAAELGLPAALAAQARPLGVYQHLYPDNFAGIEGVTTHYVVLGWTLDLPAGELQAADAQHRELRWFAPAELCADPAVHPNTRAYFDAAITAPRTAASAPGLAG
ncbi:GDP-mannose mannosyl hydrolase [Sphaerotilus natans]|uniref:GDP-mannose mannosyl hydrolase n=1 Tax=Sphaerotilus natans TaxID=34103 RepID=UPI00406CE3C2